MGSEATTTLIRAAEYVRMSTDHQKYSIANQCEVHRLYAATHGIEIVRTYADKGKSGLHLAGRDALKRLIYDVQSGNADFAMILVYDVSRWGRFQDADESAHYEFICKSAGISVRYCAEQFENDGRPISAIVKSIKRAMAGEYSRELSVKVFAAQRRLVTLGYRLGGQPGYGLRRLLVSEHGLVKAELGRGEYKCIYSDRVILIPGPPEEIATIRWIFDAFVNNGKRERDIARFLNQRNIKNVNDRLWTSQCIHRVLVSEKYIGNNVWNRHSVKLKGKCINNSPEQ